MVQEEVWLYMKMMCERLPSNKTLFFETVSKLYYSVQRKQTMKLFDEMAVRVLAV